jgi:hypothetical protein
MRLLRTLGGLAIAPAVAALATSCSAIRSTYLYDAASTYNCLKAIRSSDFDIGVQRPEVVRAGWVSGGDPSPAEIASLFVLGKGVDRDTIVIATLRPRGWKGSLAAEISFLANDQQAQLVSARMKRSQSEQRATRNVVDVLTIPIYLWHTRLNNRQRSDARAAEGIVRSCLRTAN